VRENRLIRVLAVAAVAVAVATTLAFGASTRPIPAPVTLAGVGGIKIGMEPKQVAAMFHAPTLVWPSSTDEALFVPLCSGAMQGVAQFYGTFYTPLLALWFVKGAKTPKGVGIGSTRRQVIAAYGNELHRDDWSQGDPTNLYLVGKPVPLRNPAGALSHVRPVVYFAFDRDTVTALAYGVRADVVEQNDYPPYSVICP
jgi:hypothetical protein